MLLSVRLAQRKPFEPFTCLKAAEMQAHDTYSSQLSGRCLQNQQQIQPSKSTEHLRHGSVSSHPNPALWYMSSGRGSRRGRKTHTVLLLQMPRLVQGERGSFRLYPHMPRKTLQAGKRLGDWPGVEGDFSTPSSCHSMCSPFLPYPADGLTIVRCTPRFSPVSEGFLCQRRLLHVPMPNRA